MKFKLSAIAAALLCCVSCVDSDFKLGGSLIPTDQTYSIHVTEMPITDISMAMVDSLSGYSSTRITIGAVRDDEYGLSTRSSVLTLVPLADTMDFGSNPKVKRFHLAMAMDTISTTRDDQYHILQNVNVFELDRKLSSRDFDCNGTVSHGSRKLTKGTPVLNGGDSLSFDFDLSYAQKYLSITQEDLDDLDRYLDKFPGIYLCTDAPAGNGGRINMFELQLGFNSSQGYITGNYAQLEVSSTYAGEKKDTTFYFFLSPSKKLPLDSLLTSYSTGSFPQYALNLCSHESRPMAGKAEETIKLEGGGGLKPMIKASTLISMAKEMLAAKGASPEAVVINKATIELPFEFPADYREMDRFPAMLSPTCRFRNDTSATFMSLSDSSNENENQGDIDRSNLKFAPDITYHLQEMLKIKDSDTNKKEMLKQGYYDLWFLILANEVVANNSSSSSSNSMSDYYKYLAYQSYYNNMYGGYGGYGGYGYGGYGYGGYGYGGYGGYGYDNYYSYLMMAQYASAGSSSNTVSTKKTVDKDRFYKGELNGPAAPSGRVPKLKITFSVPNKAQ